MSGSVAYPALLAGQGVQRQNSLMADPGQYLNWLNTANQLKLFPLEQERLGLANQQLQLQNMGQQLEQNLVRQNSAIGLMEPLLVGDDGKLTTGVSTKDISKALADASRLIPGWTPQQSAAVMASLPMGPNGQEDPVGNRKLLVQMYTSLEQQRGHSQQAIQMLRGYRGTVDTGQGIQGITTGGELSPNYGAITPQGAPVNTYPSKAQLIQQVQWKDENGVEHYGTLAEYAAARGMGHALGPAVPVQPGAAPQGTQAPAVGAPAAQPPAAQPATTAAPAAPQKTAQLTDTTGPMPGTPENMQASAAGVHEANARAKNFATDMFPLNNALEDLNKAPTGKGSEAIHHFSSLLQTYSPEWLQRSLAFISPVMTPEQTTAYDLAKKYLTQGQLGAPGATRSNEGLNTAGAASPSVEITPEAAKLVLKGMIGLRRMEQAGTMAFNQSGLPPAAGDKFFANFATQADPRAYMFDKMTPQQRQQAIASIKDPGKRQAFMAQVQNAEQMGLFK